MNRTAASGLLLLAAGGLQACCFRTDTPADEDAAAIYRAIPAGTLEIVEWGPRKTRAGVPFNAQGAGRAAIWVQVNRPLDGRIALIQFDDAFLEGQVSGGLVTAVVPEASYATPGIYEVRVLARTRNARWSSDTVSFTVE